MEAIPFASDPVLYINAALSMKAGPDMNKLKIKRC
jgi:hypothetical protein